MLVLFDEIAAQRQRKRTGAGDRPLGEAKAVGTLFRWAAEEGHIEANPTATIRKDRFGKHARP